jgi:hypothetical protein
MPRSKTYHAAFVLGLLAPLCASAANYCVAVNGGVDSGGTSFIGKGFALPAAGSCRPWSGFTKSSTTHVFITSGAGCLSSDGKVLTIAVVSMNPTYIGVGYAAPDYIFLCPVGTANCPLANGADAGTFGGVAVPQPCTAKLMSLPALIG